jgi:hypothetical protein
MSRRRRRDQRGGQQQPVISKTFPDWIATLKTANILGKPDLTLRDIRRNEFSIGSPTENNEVPGDYRITGIREPIDYRKLALQMAGHDLFMGDITPSDITQRVNEQDSDSLELLTQYENALRTQAGLNAVSALRDATNDPLILWVLAANYVANVEEDAPALFSPRKTEELVSRSVSIEPQPSAIVQ